MVWVWMSTDVLSSLTLCYRWFVNYVELRITMAHMRKNVRKRIPMFGSTTMPWWLMTVVGKEKLYFLFSSKVYVNSSEIFCFDVHFWVRHSRAPNWIDTLPSLNFSIEFQSYNVCILSKYFMYMSIHFLNLRFYDKIFHLVFHMD